MRTSSLGDREQSVHGSDLSPRMRRIGLIVSAAFFIEQLDTTIISTAIPQIARALEADPLTLNLTITAYKLGLASLLVPFVFSCSPRFSAALRQARAS